MSRKDFSIVSFDVLTPKGKSKGENGLIHELDALRSIATKDGMGLRLQIDSKLTSEDKRLFRSAHYRLTPFPGYRRTCCISTIQVNYSKPILRSGSICRVTNTSSKALLLGNGWWRLDIDHNALGDDPFAQMGELWHDMANLCLPGALCILTGEGETDTQKLKLYSEYFEMLCNKYDRGFIHAEWGSMFQLLPVPIVIKDANVEFNVLVAEDSGIISIDDERINGFNFGAVGGEGNQVGRTRPEGYRMLDALQAVYHPAGRREVLF